MRKILSIKLYLKKCLYKLNLSKNENKNLLLPKT